MAYTALVLSIVSLLISVGTLIAHLSLRRRLRRRSEEAAFADVLSRFSEELSARGAWPEEEIEERGQAVLARTEASEGRTAASRPAGGLAASLSATGRGAGSSAGSDLVAEGSRAAAPGGAGSRTESSVDGSASIRLEQDEVRREVRRLANEGVDVTTIARRLQLGRGEVELFLDLSRRDGSGK